MGSSWRSPERLEDPLGLAEVQQCPLQDLKPEQVGRHAVPVQLLVDELGELRESQLLRRNVDPDPEGIGDGSSRSEQGELGQRPIEDPLPYGHHEAGLLGHVHERLREHGAQQRPVPAQERLGTGHPR
jgi:hypothetical protein